MVLNFIPLYFLSTIVIKLIIHRNLWNFRLLVFMAMLTPIVLKYLLNFKMFNQCYIMFVTEQQFPSPKNLIIRFIPE